MSEGAHSWAPSQPTSDLSILAQRIHHTVVEEQEGDLQSRDHEIFVIPRVRDDRGAVRVAWQVFEQAPFFHFELGAIAAGS